MRARNRAGIGLTYWPAWLHRLSEFIPWNRFLGSINVLKYGHWTGFPTAGRSSWCLLVPSLWLGMTPNCLNLLNFEQAIN
jgi:hypothetical protein